MALWSGTGLRAFQCDLAAIWPSCSELQGGFTSQFAFSQIGIGLALGIPAVIGAGKLMTNQLFGIKPWDPIVLALATMLLGLAALLASGDRGAACRRRRADGGTAERVIGDEREC